METSPHSDIPKSKEQTARLKRLFHWKRTERRAALLTLYDLSPEQASDALERLYPMLKRHILLPVAGATGLLCLIFTVCVTWWSLSLPIALLLSGVLAGCLVGLFVRMFPTAALTEVREAQQTLLQRCDWHALKTLLKLPLSRDEIRPTLLRLLAELQTTNAAQIDEETRTLLRAQLAYSAENYAWRNASADLMIAALEALTRIGDTDSLAKVYILAHDSQAATAKEKQVREAARMALPILEAQTDFGPVEAIGDRIDEYLRVVFLSDNRLIVLLEKSALLNLTLKHLLPRLNRDNAGLLTAKQWDKLRHLLPQNDVISVPADTLLQQAIVQAIEQAGQVRLQSAIETLAHMQAPTPALRDLREAAGRCLKTLEALAEQYRQSETLLRATEAPIPPAEQLLRPATGIASQTEPEQLLRSTEQRA